MELNRLKIGIGNGKIFYIKHRHIHIIVIGKSGTGKSSIILLWWESDGNRVCKILIDPQGFLAQDCYALSRGKARYLSLAHPISVNPMASGYPPAIITDIISQCINQIIRQSTDDANKAMTAKMIALLYEAIRYCLENGRLNLICVRDRLMNMPGNSETRDGIISRLNFLLNDERMIPILCGNSAIKWGEIIDRGEQLIVDGFGMSREKMIFVGNLISQGLVSYFRYERPAKFKPCAVYIDEAHLFINQNFMDILKEGRKFNLSVVLATQDFAYIPEQMARVMLNVGNIVCYRVGFREANLIAREMGKIKEDLIELVLRGEHLVEKVTSFDTQELLQNMEKWHCAYTTPDDKGIAKVSRPPLVRKIEIKAEPKIKSKGWFTLESCQLESPQ